MIAARYDYLQSRNDLIFSVLIVFTFITFHPYGFMAFEDTVVYFGYYNNSIHPGVPFYWAGYVSLIPEMTAFMAAHLPFWGQPPVYLLATAFVSVYFIFQLTYFVNSYFKDNTVSYCVVAGIITAFVVRPGTSFNMFTNLTYAMWTAWLGFYLKVLNMYRGKPPRFAEAFVSVFAALSNPFCVLMIPSTALFVCFGRPIAAPRRWEAIAYLLAELFYCVFFIERSHSSQINIAEIAHQLALMFSQNLNFNSVAAAGSALTLSAFALFSGYRLIKGGMRTWPTGSSPDLEIITISYVGIMTLGAYVTSSRFTAYDSLEPRYVITANISVVLALIALMASRSKIAPNADPSARPLAYRPRKVIFVGACVALVLFVNSHKGRHAPKIGFDAFVDVQNFMVSAERYRKRCASGALIDHWNNWSLVILCRPAALPSGVDPVAISEDAVTVQDVAGLFSTLDRPCDVLPRLYEPINDISILHVR